MKRVSFEVAKYLKGIGYPQNIKASTYYSTNGYLCTDGSCNYVCAAPFVMDVWLWLCREKKIFIEVCHTNKQGWFTELMKDSNNDPEEAIEAAIEYLVYLDFCKWKKENNKE